MASSAGCFLPACLLVVTLFTFYLLRHQSSCRGLGESYSVKIPRLPSTEEGLLPGIEEELLRQEAVAWFQKGAQGGFDRGLELFRDYLQHNQQELQRSWDWAKLRPRGIVISAGYARSLANAYVNLHVMRHLLKSELPAVVMYWGSNPEDRPNKPTVAFFQQHVPDVEFIDASALSYPPHHRDLSHGSFNGWKVKAFAVYAAPFQEILYLDSDSAPVLEPTFLFDDATYLAKGNLFWPDIWCGPPGSGHGQGLWDLVGMPKADPHARQTESGQFLLNKDEVTYAASYGDKDTFRAAFFLADRLHDFQTVAPPVSLALDHISASGAMGDYMVRGFLQGAPSGGALFVHRVSDHKFNPQNDDTKPISHIAIPSCNFFHHHGWRPDSYPGSILQQPRPCQGNATFMELYTDALQRCGGGYDPQSAPGEERPPLFEISPGSHLRAALTAAEDAFRVLREAKAAATRDNVQLF